MVDSQALMTGDIWSSSKDNIKQYWWKKFVDNGRDMYGVVHGYCP